LNNPEGLAWDAEGRLLVADAKNHRVRSIDLDGRLRTVAGTGEAGFAGDGGPALSARLDQPFDLCVGPDGVVIADGNDRIRKADSEGTITTVPGTGTPGFSGDGGPATATQLDGPYGVARPGTRSGGAPGQARAALIGERSPNPPLG
jgi:hypothetical protein